MSREESIKEPSIVYLSVYYYILFRAFIFEYKSERYVRVEIHMHTLWNELVALFSINLVMNVQSRINLSPVD